MHVLPLCCLCWSNLQSLKIEWKRSSGRGQTEDLSEFYHKWHILYHPKRGRPMCVCVNPHKGFMLRFSESVWSFLYPVCFMHFSTDISVLNLKRCCQLHHFFGGELLHLKKCPLEGEIIQQLTIPPTIPWRDISSASTTSSLTFSETCFWLSPLMSGWRAFAETNEFGF